MENSNIKEEIITENESDFLKLKDLFYISLAKWYWYATAIAVAMIIAVAFLLMTEPTYSRYASVLISDDNKGGGVSADVGAIFSDMGFMNTNSNVNNEVIAFQSPALMSEVVKRLNLEVRYRAAGKFHKEELYGTTLPYEVKFMDITERQGAEVRITEKEQGVFELTDMVLIENGEEIEFEDVIECRSGERVKSPLGMIEIDKRAGYDSIYDKKVYISKSSVHSMTESCMQKLSVTLAADKATIINLTYDDVSIERAEDVLNTLIAVYNEKWIKDKNQIAVSTSAFITERLAVIEEELGNVDSNISTFKSENLIPDLQSTSNMYMDRMKETNSQIINLNMQLSMARYIKGYLSGNIKKGMLLPANTGLESSSIEGQIDEYNKMQLQRNSLSANSSEDNPLVLDMDKRLEALKGAVMASVENYTETLKRQISDLENEEKKNIGKIAENPKQASYLLTVERQQKIKEALYLFLLQKREENELSQAFTAYNTRIITPPTGSFKAIAPNNQIVLLISLVLGLIIPLVIIFIQETTNTTVHSKKDLEGMSVPFAGEIPQADEKMGGVRLNKKGEKRYSVMVSEGKNDIINEAFRIVRTNIEFMMNKPGAKVIMLTSSISESGKTFIALNLAKSFAIKGKRVLMIDMDMRKASLSDAVGVGKPGVADYLAGYAEIADIVRRGGEKSADIIPVGSIPPNPVELLFDKRMKELMERMREEYEYIFIDCPPAGILADTDIIGKHAEHTLYVVRAGNLDRRQLPEIERYYREEKYRNMALILNGTENIYGKYGYTKYGYGYGHGYYGKKTHKK